MPKRWRSSRSGCGPSWRRKHSLADCRRAIPGRELVAPRPFRLTTMPPLTAMPSLMPIMIRQGGEARNRRPRARGTSPPFRSNEGWRRPNFHRRGHAVRARYRRNAGGRAGRSSGEDVRGFPCRAEKVDQSPAGGEDVWSGRRSPGPACACGRKRWPPPRRVSYRRLLHAARSRDRLERR